MKTFPKEFLEVAKIHALKRCKFNESSRNSNDDFFAVDPNLADLIGVLAEIIAAYEMIKKGKGFFLNDLFAEKTLAGSDVLVQDNSFLYRIDVKGTTKDIAYVPVYKVDKSEKIGISHYWIIKINLKEYTYVQKFMTIEKVKECKVVHKYKKDNYEIEI